MFRNTEYVHCRTLSKPDARSRPSGRFLTPRQSHARFVGHPRTHTLGPCELAQPDYARWPRSSSCCNTDAHSVFTVHPVTTVMDLEKVGEPLIYTRRWTGYRFIAWNPKPGSPLPRAFTSAWVTTSALGLHLSFCRFAISMHTSCAARVCCAGDACKSDVPKSLPTRPRRTIMARNRVHCPCKVPPKSAARDQAGTHH